MDCQCCQKKPAHIRVCDIEANTMSEQFNVCADCWIFIKRYLFDHARPLQPTREVLQEVRQLLSSQEPKALAKLEPPGEITPVPAESLPVCPECGMTLAEFKHKGRFGCARDYEVFAAHLDPLLERIHDVTPPRHRGGRPAPAPGADERVNASRELSGLREQLRAAVAEENYELAARLRDRINELERGNLTPGANP
ncbi:MAG: UvrB/UvrC motif-containing protein [Planctomycetes bacterium]|jgi:protein arginine kinase activator|nr:UvrB/UvrC motif-containing protein [Planctomycetota bacterium]MCL4729277.1 UvrB/UvrC motif-containing protein [Planctomycetota bacterium]